MQGPLPRFSRAAAFLAVIAAWAGASDSLYADCDTVSHGHGSAYVEVLPDPVPQCAFTNTCEPRQISEKKLPDGTLERYEYRLQEGRKVKDGAYLVRYDSARIKEKGEYAFGLRTGEWAAWHANGRKKYESTYKGGRLDGTSLEYWPNGKVMEEWKYSEGKIDCRDGYHKSYHRGGQPKFELRIRDSMLDRYVLFDSTGRELNLPIMMKR